MDFDCDFNAPMFVDFQNMDGDHHEQEQAEAYFDVHHPDHERDQIDLINKVQPNEVDGKLGQSVDINLKSNENSQMPLEKNDKPQAMDEEVKVSSIN